MKRSFLLAFGAVLALGNVVQADPVSRTYDPSHGGSIDEDATPLVVAGKPTRDRVWVDIDPGEIAAANTNIIYLNNCKPPQNCFVTRAQSASSINNTWPLNVNSGTLSPYSFGDTSWNNVVAC